MATVKLDALNAAYDEGLVKGNLSERQRLYLNPSISTADMILKALRTEQLSTEQLAARLNLHRNTLLIYLRWLEEKKLVMHYANGAANIYYREPIN
ncbi:MAG: hypothetical protein LRZ84_14675 [Desertifilum sp.]|nr:hypothetical protein [Desertifilum sp.]